MARINRLYDTPLREPLYYGMPEYPRQLARETFFDTGCMQQGFTSQLTMEAISQLPRPKFMISSDNLVINGVVSVMGSMPFLGTVDVQGELPMFGMGSVQYGSGEAEVGVSREIPFK
ncbi:unnamed protein product [Leptidea sinapis]|uniref:Uncharacterized protein n=1 Tax=Leptidea sinapis TaxID=189913 RepID=A0A5E4Q715_9NEOP|nr:unnamed protein product [Leptidea sinapis]